MGSIITVRSIPFTEHFYVEYLVNELLFIVWVNVEIKTGC